MILRLETALGRPLQRIRVKNLSVNLSVTSQPIEITPGPRTGGSISRTFTSGLRDVRLTVAGVSEMPRWGRSVGRPRRWSVSVPTSVDRVRYSGKAFLVEFQSQPVLQPGRRLFRWSAEFVADGPVVRKVARLTR